MRKLVNLDRLSPEEVQFTPRRARHVLTEPVPKYELPASGYIRGHRDGEAAAEPARLLLGHLFD